MRSRRWTQVFFIQHSGCASMTTCFSKTPNIASWTLIQKNKRQSRQKGQKGTNVMPTDVDPNITFSKGEDKRDCIKFKFEHLIHFICHN